MQFNSAISVDVLSLPATSWTRSQFEYAPNDNMWIIPDSSRGRYFNFSTLGQQCCAELVLSLKKTLIWYLRERSTCHANNMFNLFRNLVNEIAAKCEISSISIHHIISYKGNLAKENEYYLGALSGFLKKWHEMGYPGIDADAYAVLNGFRIQGNRKGAAVMTFDPEEGPFDELELHAIHEAVNTAYAEGKIGNREFSLIWMFMATGARPVQVASLKLKDFSVVANNDGEMEYIVNMPRAKQRYTVVRRVFKLRRLIPDVGIVLEAWIAQVKLKYATDSADCLPQGELPIFPSWGNEITPGFEHHSTGNMLSKEIKDVLSTLEVKSHRTGQKMHITPRRFRYTLGTRAAMEKHGEMIIAELLDHNDTQNVQVYVKCTPEILEHLDKALAMVLAPYADAFAGKVVADDAETKNSNDPTSLVRHPKLNPKDGGVGRCGSGCSECGAMVPVACYVCRNFQAWLDAPHELVLNELIEERKRILEQTGDERIAFANDHVILAVSQVIIKCTEMKEVACG